MREHILVCPFDEKLFEQIHDESLVVIAPSFEQIPNAFHEARNRNNRVKCVVVYSKGSLVSIPFHESWKGIPIAIYVEELGPFKEFMARLQPMRDMNIRIFMNSDRKENLSALHILASLHISCGIAFGEKDIDWEAMNDLMTYSAYGKTRHAPVEPFHFITTKYNPDEYNEYRTVYFDNPRTYLHIDKDLNVAISKKDLSEGNFITSGIEGLDKIKENPKFEEALNKWQNFFLQNSVCAFCQSWRICMGTFAGQIERNPGCQKFFTDLMEATDHVLSSQQKDREREVWQL